METTKEYDQMIVDKITALIYPKYLTEAKVELMVCKNATNNIKVSFGVNPWRYGLTKGAMPFASINSSAINPSITFFGKFSEDFSKLGMNYTEEKTYTVRTCINVDLQNFITHLNNPTDEFVKIINRIFISNVSFPEFGCCSKYSECEEAGKCLHADQLYATACQFHKLMKRTGKFENN